MLIQSFGHFVLTTLYIDNLIIYRPEIITQIIHQDSTFKIKVNYRPLT